MGYKLFLFAPKKSTESAQQTLSQELDQALAKHLDLCEHITSIDGSLTTKVFFEEEVIAFYIQSNLPGRHIPIYAGGQKDTCSAIVHMFGMHVMPKHEDLGKDLDEIMERYHI